MTNITPITKARQRIGYTLEVFPAQEEGKADYIISNPDGTLYCDGWRQGTTKEVGDFYQKTVERLNREAGFKSRKWSEGFCINSEAARICAIRGRKWA